MAEAFRKPTAAPHNQGPELQTGPVAAAQAASSPPGQGPACRVGPASEVRPPLVITVMATAMAAMGLLVALLPVVRLLAGQDDLLGLGFGFALLGIALMVVALCLLYWLWMWDSLRLVLVILALFLAFGEALGHPVGSLSLVWRLVLSLEMVVVAVLMGRAEVAPYYAAMVSRDRGGRDPHTWSEGQGLQVGGFLLGITVLAGFATARLTQAEVADFRSLIYLGIAALALWVVGCARYAGSKGYSEWGGLLLAALGPIGFALLAWAPVRDRR